MPRFQCQNSAHRLINPVSGYFSLFRHFNNGIHNVFKFLQGTGIVNRTGHEKHIDSGVDSHPIDVILIKMLCDRLHFKSIRHNDPVEIHFVTKNVRENLSGQCCGDHHFFPGLLGDIGLIIQVGILDMGSHNHFGTGFDPHPERDQLSLIELFQCFLHSGKSGVAVRTGISMTGKMFQDGNRTALGHSLEKRCPVIRDDFGVIRKGAHPYDRIIGIVIDIHDYAEISVNGKQRELPADPSCCLSGVLNVTGRSDSHISGPFSALPEAGDNTSLLIDRNQQRDGVFAFRHPVGLLHIVHKSHCLFVVAAVFGIKQHSSEAIPGNG